MAFPVTTAHGQGGQPEQGTGTARQPGGAGGRGQVLRLAGPMVLITLCVTALSRMAVMLGLACNTRRWLPSRRRNHQKHKKHLYVLKEKQTSSSAWEWDGKGAPFLRGVTPA